mmetsp:Transcript_25499/g.29419  ORF Transcript_25499/g.29419 Transcript_25499/m.29419 type:complete len:115 (-) Transcript_25499:471-815(-)
MTKESDGNVDDIYGRRDRLVLYLKGQGAGEDDGSDGGGGTTAVQSELFPSRKGDRNRSSPPIEGIEGDNACAGDNRPMTPDTNASAAMTTRVTPSMVPTVTTQSTSIGVGRICN